MASSSTTVAARTIPHGQAEKPEKFSGLDFKRWQQKMLFYLTTLGVAGYIKENAPVVEENEPDVNKRTTYDQWINADFLCKAIRLYILPFKVKVWCTKQEASVLNIDMKANICSVKYNPGSSVHIAVGSADHHIYYYDLRNINQPLHILSGHRKAVSYVKFLSNNELASASTDSTVRLWDVKENVPLRVFRGHANEKNFVGLTVNSEYLACGSETNEVFVYHKAISRPAVWHRFVNSGTDEAEEDSMSYFISAVCWKSDSPTMLTANSQGTIKVLVLAP